MANAAELALDPLADRRLFAVGDNLRAQLAPPLIQLRVGQFRPDRTRTETVHLLVGVGDEADELVAGRSEGNRVSVHVGETLDERSETVKGFSDFFFRFFSAFRLDNRPGVKKKHNCHVIVSTFRNELFQDVYPELEFVNPGTIVNNIDGMYTLGWFYDESKEEGTG